MPNKVMRLTARHFHLLLRRHPAKLKASHVRGSLTLGITLELQ
jgi:hypothetical protein